ncbi:MAG: hypothetical protein PUJ70_00980 [Treponema sp.]|nr:hypothetical protein [Treponema sp.]MDY5837953.1 hypothetical protein [Treponema sp.]
MSSGPKIALSLLISVLIFAGCVFLSIAGGFKLIEVQFYQPRVIANANDRLSSIEKAYGEYSSNLDNEFRKFLSEKSVKTFIERAPEKEAMNERGKLSALLYQKISGLNGMRLIENDGIHIHFSTFGEDTLTETSSLISYKNYTDANKIPFTLLEASDGEKQTKIYFDSIKNELVFSYPFYDNYTAYRGTFIFYVLGDDFTQYLIDRELVSLNARGTVCSPNGFVFNLPITGRELLMKEIEQRWSRKIQNVEQLVQSDTKSENIFIITQGNDRIKIGEIRTQDAFEFSDIEKLLLLICLFITLYLIIFLLFNIRHDDMVIVCRRLRKFQYELLKEYIDRKDSMDWKTLSKEIAHRKNDVNSEIKKSLGRRGKKHSKEVDELLEDLWTDVMSAMGGNVSVVRQVVSSNPIAVASTEKTAAADNIEELEEVSDADEVEELEEIPDADEVEELEEIPDADEVEELEEIPDADEVEELEEIPDADEVEELEEIPDADEVEELEEIPDADEVEELEEIPDADEVEELEEIPDADEVEKISETVSKAEPELPATEEISEEKMSKFMDSSDTEMEEVQLDEFIDISEDESFTSNKKKNSDEEVEIIEESYEEFKKSDSPDEEISENAENIKREASRNFSISTLNFDSLDEEDQAKETKISHGLLNKAENVATTQVKKGGLLNKVLKANSTKTIVEEDGIFSINKNLETSGVQQDPELKALVDSVLK